VKIISIGEILWDVFNDSEHLGGAPFNFAVHARRIGHEAILVSAVGQDEPGQRAFEEVTAAGLSPRFIKRIPEQPTGRAAVRMGQDGEPEFTIHRPAAYDFVTVTETEADEISVFSPDWIYYGTLLQMSEIAKQTTRLLLESNPGALRFYDVNLRTGSYTADIVREFMAESNVVKLNESEVLQVQEMFGSKQRSLEGFCKAYSAEFGWGAVCVTRGNAGSAVWVDGAYGESGGYAVKVVDTVGAGDAFAAAFLHGLDLGWDPEDIAEFANRVAALVCSRSGGTPEWTIEEALALSPA
jgi:fructokinase